MEDLNEPEEFMSDEKNNTDPVLALIDQWRNLAENGVFTGGAGPDIRETLMECADELEAALASEPPEDRFEQFVQAEIARSPNALRELGCYLADVLDEDRFPRANRLLLQLATEYAPPSTPAPAAVAVAYRDALYGTRWIKQLRDMEPGTQWFIEGRAEPIATVTSRASVTWHMATSEIPHGTAYYTAPPSAHVGVECNCPGEGKADPSLHAPNCPVCLSQQPAGVDEAMPVLTELVATLAATGTVTGGRIYFPERQTRELLKKACDALAAQPGVPYPDDAETEPHYDR